MPSRYHNQATEALIKALADLTDQTAETIRVAAEILAELKTRGENHPLMREGILRWYAPIAEGKLSPKAAIAFAGVNSIIRRLIGMPLAKQEAFAKGEPLIFAKHNNKGEVISDQRPLLELSARQLDIALEQGEIRSFPAQRKILIARGQEHRKRRRSSSPINIRADLEAGEIICGQMRFTPHQLAGALKQLGYTIQKRRAA
jgi:hypothetical protein